MTTLEARLLAAHATADGAALVAHYAEAAEIAPSEMERGFFLTQAYVYALETGHPDTGGLRQRLRDLGREE